MSTHAVFVADEKTGDPVPAELDDAVTPETLLDIEAQWENTRSDIRKRLLAAKVPGGQWPQSLHWNWGDKSLLLSLFKKPHSYRIFGLRRHTVWEGAMVTLLGEAVTRHPPQLGLPLVYVDYLEGAPWNWTIGGIQQVRKLRGISSVLLRAAIAQSRAEQCDGRLGLHSLPQAEPIYLGAGFVQVAFDAAKNLNYFELTADAAQRFERG
jgi:hypothetical protein